MYRFYHRLAKGATGTDNRLYVPAHFTCTCIVGIINYRYVGSACERRKAFSVADCGGMKEVGFERSTPVSKAIEFRRTPDVVLRLSRLFTREIIPFSLMI